MRITVITPTYNRASFLAETIDSVLNQDYPDLEYLLLDDGSTDETEALIANNYEGRLTYLKHPNMGEAKTVNRGYGLATGEVVLVVNSDDPLWSSQAVSKAMACFKEDPQTTLVYPDWVLIDEQGKVLAERRLPLYSLELMLMNFNVALGPGLFIRKSYLEENYFRNSVLKYTGDLDLSFRIFREGKKVAHISELLASHRMHADSASLKERGRLMSQEVFRLCQEVFAHPAQLTPLCKQEKKKILALAAYHASEVAGEPQVKIKWLWRALIYNRFKNHILYSNGTLIILNLRPLFLTQWLLLLHRSFLVGKPHENDTRK